MERIKIALPDNIKFATNIVVRITDINYGNHVGNDAYLNILHEARMQYLQQFGYTELSFEGIGLIMADVAIEYKHELIYGDAVTVFVVANGFDKLGFDIFYKMMITKNGQNILVAKAKTGMICFDYTLKNKVQVPPIAVEAIKGE